MRPLLLSSAPVLALFLAGCTPGDGSASVTAVPEVEPNGTASQATPAGGPGTYTYFGTCQIGNAADWFKAQADGGNVEASIYTSGTPMGSALTTATAALPTFALLDQSLAVLDQTTEVTAQAAIAGQLTGAQTVYLQIGCPQTARVYYYGTLRVP